MAKIPAYMLGLALLIALAFAGALALTSHTVPGNLWNLMYALAGGTAVASPTPATAALIAKEK